MTSPAPLDPRQAPGGETDLVSDVTPDNGILSGTLSLPEDDPYFFDHPLDHVPGMALVGGLLDLLRTGEVCDPERTGSLLSLDLALPSFCELDEEVQLEAIPHSGFSPAGTGSATVCARQGERVVCEGEVSVRRADPDGDDSAEVHSAFLDPADQDLVHRRREENVLISDVSAAEGLRTVTIIRPSDDHRLAAAPGRPLPAEAMIDAARQFGTLISHVEHGAGEDERFILLNIRADLPGGPRSDVHLRWTVTPAPRGRANLVLEVVTDDPYGEASGSIDLEYYAASPAMYDRIRGDGGTA